jgi:hypothetical protein
MNLTTKNTRQNSRLPIFIGHFRAAFVCSVPFVVNSFSGDNTR